MKKWAGFAKSTNTALLYLPNKKGSTNFLSLTYIYKCIQVSCHSQLLICVQYHSMISHSPGRSLKPLWWSEMS